MMRILLCFLCIIALLPIGCTTGKTGSTAAVEKNYDSLGPIVAAYLPAREADSVARWGMVREDGTMLFSNMFSSRPSASVNGYFTVKDHGGYTVYRTSGHPQAVEGLQNLVSAGVMSGGLMPVTRKGGRIEIVDGDGVVRMQLPAVDGKEIVKASPYFVCGVLPVCLQDGKWGGVSSSGTLVLDAVYDNEPEFSEGMAAVCRTETDDTDSTGIKKITRWFLVDAEGGKRCELPSGIKPVGKMRGGKLAIRTSAGRMGFVDTEGHISLLNPEVAAVTDYNDKYIVWTDKHGACGVSDSQGNLLVSPDFEAVRLLCDSLLVSLPDNVYAVTDSAGTVKVRLTGFDSVESLKYIGKGIPTPFELVGDGFAGRVLLDLSGHRIGKGPFKEISTDATLLDDGYVHTDFFNHHAAVHEIVSGLTVSGWGRAKLGTPLAGLTDSLTKEMKELRSVIFESDSTYQVRCEAVAYGSQPIAVDSVLDDERIALIPNNKALIKYIRIETEVPVAAFASMLETLGGELVDAGFHAVKLRDEYAVYSAADRYIVVTPRRELRGLYFYLMYKRFYDEAGQSIIADAEKQFGQNTVK